MTHARNDAKLGTVNIRRDVAARFHWYDRVLSTINNHGWHGNILQFWSAVLQASVQGGSPLPFFAGWTVRSQHGPCDPLTQNALLGRISRTPKCLPCLHQPLDIRLFVDGRAR